MSGVNNTIWELPADEKFDGIRPFRAFKIKLESVAGSWGLDGYLSGEITKPQPLITAPPVAGATAVATATPATSVYSINPSLEEWKYRDNKMRSTISMNVEEIGSMIDDISSKSAATIWQELNDRYIRRDDMRMNFADSAFKSYRFVPGGSQTIAEFFKQLRIKRKEAMDYGNTYTDAVYRSTIVNALAGREFDTMLQALSGVLEPSNLVEQIEIFYAREEARTNKVAAKPTQLLASSSSTEPSIQALQARIAQLESRDKRAAKKCSNCDKVGHLKESCWAKGGGAVGKAPSWWQPPKGDNDKDAGSKPMSNLAVATLSQHYALSAFARGNICLDLHDPGDTVVVEDCLRSSAPNGTLEGVEQVPLKMSPTPARVQGSEIWSEESFADIWTGSSPRWEDIELAERISILCATIGIINAKEFILTVLDSGASDHFITRREDFITYEPISAKDGLSSKKGSSFTIIGKGRARKTFIIDNHEVTLTFEALHAPDVTSDLISVSELDSKDFSVLFSKGIARVFDHNELHILTATKRNGLYIFDVKESAAALTAKSLDKPIDMAGWHNRFGHAGIDRIRDLFVKELVDGGRVQGSVTVEACVPCIHGKGIRRSFDGEVTPQMEPLMRVHTDLCGPMRTEGRKGFLYSMPIIDDGTSFTRQYYLKDKSAATTLEAIEGYRVESERQTGKKLKVVRVDGGGEFDNALWHDWAKQHGIIIEIIPPHSSAANGVAERKHRSIYSRVRTILYHSGLPASLWCWAAEYIVYTDNLLPSSRHPGTIPAEKFGGKRQNVAHLRPFGCRAFAKIVDGKPGKLDDQVFEGKMVGYDERGVYWLYRSNGSIVRSRDVVFDEKMETPKPQARWSNDEEDFEVMPATVNDDATDPAAEDIDRAEPNVDQDRGVDPMFDHPPQNAPPAMVPEPEMPRRSARFVPSVKLKEAQEYMVREKAAKDSGDAWADKKSAQTHARAKPKANQAETTTKPTFLPESINTLDASDNIALTALGLPAVPRNYAEAMRDPERWRPAMEEEMRRMEAFEVFGPAGDVPPGGTVLGVMWVFAHKLNGLGEIVGEKARLVVQGQHQVEGRDYYKKYAGVMRLESLRMLLAVWVTLDFFIWQIDFKSAYLNAKLEEKLWIRLPRGFMYENSPEVVLPLLRALYGAVQSGNVWWKMLNNAYKLLGYTRSTADQCVRVRRSELGETHTGTYTDDTAGASSTKEEAERAKSEIGERFPIKVTDDVEFSLGMRLTHDREKGTASLSMRAYFERLLDRHGFSDIRPKTTPFALGTVLSKKGAPSTDEELAFMKDKPYDAIVGGLQYAVGAMRPDLSYSVNVLSRFSRNPGPSHWKALVHVLAYVKGTLDLGLTYRRDVKDGLIPITYVDADYGGCPDTRRSTMGVLTKMAGAPTFWMSKRHDTMAMSTVEAEFMALCRGAQQATWAFSFMTELGYPQKLPMVVYNDNQGSLSICENPSDHARSKHIDSRFMKIRELVNPEEEGATQKLAVEYVASADNPADILTKSLSANAHWNQIDLMGINRSV